MKINYDKLHDFITQKPDKYWDTRSISLEEIGYDNPEELTVERLVNLLDYVNFYCENECLDESLDSRFTVKIDFDGEDTYCRLEMKWKEIFDK